MPKPELKQFGDLTVEDFQRHPVWIGCHTADYDEPWYEETDEETFRPRGGDLPADPSEGMILVRATATLRDGSRWPGFLTPAFEAGDLGIIQPQLFAQGRMFSFWGGIFGVPPERRAAFYEALGKGAAEVFPIRFAAEPGVSAGVASVDVEGFYKKGRKKVETVR